MLKKNYGLTQGQLELVGAAHNLGGYSSFISGLVYDALEHRQHVGPRLSLVIGCLVNMVGFFMLWAAVTKKFEAALWQIACLAILAGNGGTWYDTSPLATNLRNFPASRGTVVGLIKASIGLSASLYTAAFSGFFYKDAGSFLLFLAIVPPSIALILTPLVNYVPYLQKSELSKSFTTEQRFLLALKLVSGLALYLMLTALLNGLTHVSEHMRAWFAVGAALLLIPFSSLSYDSGGLYSQKASFFACGEDEEEDEEARNLPRHTQAGAGDGDVSVDGTSVDDLPTQPRMIPSLTLGQCFVNINFWILAVICGVGIGSGLAFLNNSAQLVGSLHGPSKLRSIVVTFFGVSSCAGRLIFGVVPERALHHHGVPRPVFLVLSSAVSAFTYFIMAFSPPAMLYILSIVSGLCFGAHWSLLPSLASELFGLDNFASIYTTLQLSPAAWGYGLGAYLIGILYEVKGKEHGDPENSCFGSDCFRDSFLIISVMCVLSTALSSWLTMRTLRLYRAEYGALRVFERDTEIDEPLRG